MSHGDLQLGKVDRSKGLSREAQEHLTLARKMYEQMDMTFWTGQAETALRA